MTSDDAVALAAEAGLHYVETGAPGLRRVRRGRGFSYVDASGTAADPRARAWVESLAVPPAWRDVWISNDRLGHILATGVDQAGRKQYVYHPDWVAIRDEVKFDRLHDFGEGLTDLRRGLDRALRRPGLNKEKVVALAVAILDRTLVRVGNRRYTEENESYGLTTLTSDHIEVNGSHVHLEFAGKGGSDVEIVFEDRRLASLVRRCQELEGQTLFSYPADGGDLESLTSTDVNGYLASAMGGPFTAKDFRTWGASSLVLGELANTQSDDPKAVLAAVDAAADHLGNTRAVCRDSYVHPAVVDAHANGSLNKAWRSSRTGRWLSRPESALRRLLETEGQ